MQVPVYVSKYFDEAHHMEDGLMGYCVAALLPNSKHVDQVGGKAEIKLQILLDDFGKMDID